MGAPQIIVIILWAITFTVHAMKHGEHNLGKAGLPRRYNVNHTLIGIILFGALLYWGGFFG